jgi:hypothetical protein
MSTWIATFGERLNVLGTGLECLRTDPARRALIIIEL